MKSSLPVVLVRFGIPAAPVHSVSEMQLRCLQDRLLSYERWSGLSSRRTGYASPSYLRKIPEEVPTTRRAFFNSSFQFENRENPAHGASATVPPPPGLCAKPGG